MTNSSGESLEAIADQFDLAHRQNQNPVLREYLKRTVSKNRLSLAKLLVPIDIEYRVSADEPIDAADYAKIHPALEKLAQKAIDATAGLQISGVDTQVTLDSNTMPGPSLVDSKDASSDHQSSSERKREFVMEADSTYSSPANANSNHRQIGNYKLLHQIGEGGMGTVWLAEQTQPVQRRVAIKLVRADRGSKHALARFDAERQALAMMDHQNIAKVLDAGSTDDGHPYFVMELVKGVPLTEYCDDNKLSIRDRLELFIPVCQAVQHAHQKGIIHRDLKPSNVLVCLNDGQPVPKVIDFGLAKALEHTTKLTDKTMFTEFGQVVGTLQYMSPEQAEMNQLDIDTRTDIYSLGVMLYELLTGSTPLDKETMGKNALLQLLKIIRETEPPRPSTRLSSVGETANGISQQRKITTIKLQQLLRGELDWVVMKALEKDRTRRYANANDLANDISRYLNNEVVLAKPPSSSYRFKKYIQKNKGPVASLASIATLLLVALGVTTWLWRDSLAANQLAEKKTDEAVHEKNNARSAERKLELEKVILIDQSQRDAEAQKMIMSKQEDALAAIGYVREADLMADYLANLMAASRENNLRFVEASMSDENSVAVNFVVEKETPITDEVSYSLVVPYSETIEKEVELYGIKESRSFLATFYRTETRTLSHRSENPMATQTNDVVKLIDLRIVNSSYEKLSFAEIRDLLSKRNSTILLVTPALGTSEMKNWLQRFPDETLFLDMPDRFGNDWLTMGQLSQISKRVQKLTIPPDDFQVTYSEDQLKSAVKSVRRCVRQFPSSEVLRAAAIAEYQYAHWQLYRVGDRELAVGGYQSALLNAENSFWRNQTKLATLLPSSEGEAIGRDPVCLAVVAISYFRLNQIGNDEVPQRRGASIKGDNESNIVNKEWVGYFKQLLTAAESSQFRDDPVVRAWTSSAKKIVLADYRFELEQLENANR